MDDSIDWLANPVVLDLIQQFPLPIALMSHSGRSVVLNSHFEKNYGRDVLDSTLLQTSAGKSGAGWHTVHVADRRQGEINVKARVVRFRGDSMLILNDAVDPELLQQVRQLHARVSELERRSSTDPLTGLWNRAHFNRVVACEIDRSVKYQQPVALILIDIDHFKTVNDTFGHRVGDTVLCELVKVIGGAIRSVDSVFRWGGEEFVVMVASTGYRGAATLAERMRREVENHRFAAGGPVTISLGVAEYLARERADIWFNRVDGALYRAKRGGRNRVCVDRRGSSDLWAARSGLSVVRLVWQEAYECGQPKIDTQHRELFDLSNVLLDAACNSESEPAAFGEALDDLVMHVAQHFADEEELLQQHQYHDLSRHRRAHGQLLKRAAELKNAVTAGETQLGTLVNFLANNVVAQHFFKADRDFYPLFRNAAHDSAHSCPATKSP
jgi:diguanylate cyclase (GGDEF)-like protein/hemerythrin-like metal-binding protein